ncbi:MAG TPA: TonB family protein, partial [Bacteroidaceae bacterium]|nr:TonB family protein [Bacteroidaceae bacterium]
MMKKTCSSRIEIWKYFLLVPAILMMLGLFSGTRAQDPVSLIKGKVIFANTGEAAAGTSVVISGTTTGTVTDMNGDFILEVEGDPEIVFSFVGFNTTVLKASEIKNKPIALEVKTYQLNLDEAGKIKPSIEAPSEEPEDVFIIVEEMPSFPGGETALKHYVYSNLEYPENALKNGISGRVFIQFTVTTSGLLDDIKVIRSTNEGFDEAALKVFRTMPRWNPGMQRGKPVNVQLTVPVQFSLSSE